MKERRSKGAQRRAASGTVTLVTEPNSRFATKIEATLVNQSDLGVCVEVLKPLPLGIEILVEGQDGKASWTGNVCWLNVADEGRYRAGIELRGGAQAGQVEIDTEEDLYETLQVSPKADFDTIQRIYRMLAQRYHPDHKVTGDETKFHQLLHAYETLSDPEKRAAYDVQLSGQRRKHWTTFRNKQEGDGISAERRKRSLILSVMYRKRQRTPEQPQVSVHELEQVLGIEKEHLEFTFWYLREKGLVLRSDNGRFSITAHGVEEFEEMELPVGSERQQGAIEGGFDETGGAAATPS
jgi:DnaJ-domain-containing protein 1